MAERARHLQEAKDRLTEPPQVVPISVAEINSLPTVPRRYSRQQLAEVSALENLRAALALRFAWYNLVRIHRTLRITPAMAADISDRVWDLRDLL